MIEVLMLHHTDISHETYWCFTRLMSVTKHKQHRTSKHKDMMAIYLFIFKLLLFDLY